MTARLDNKHPRPWKIVDPNGAFPHWSYRPIWIKDVNDIDVLYVGNAGPNPDILTLAQVVVDVVNRDHEERTNPCVC